MHYSSFEFRETFYNLGAEQMYFKSEFLFCAKNLMMVQKKNLSNHRPVAMALLDAVSLSAEQIAGNVEKQTSDHFEML